MVCSFLVRVGQDLGETVPGEGGRAVAVAAGHVLVGDERVGHGLFGGLDDGLEERVDFIPRDELQLAVGVLRGLRALGALFRVFRGEGGVVGGGDGQEDVA